MKHTGTIEIDCNKETCGNCVWCDINSDRICFLFNCYLKHDEPMEYQQERYYRLPACIDKFSPEISEGKIRQIMAGGSGIEDIKKALENK